MRSAHCSISLSRLAFDDWGTISNGPAPIALPDIAHPTGDVDAADMCWRWLERTTCSDCANGAVLQLRGSVTAVALGRLAFDYLRAGAGVSLLGTVWAALFVSLGNVGVLRRWCNVELRRGRDLVLPRGPTCEWTIAGTGSFDRESGPSRFELVWFVAVLGGGHAIGLSWRRG